MLPNKSPFDRRLPPSVDAKEHGATPHDENAIALTLADLVPDRTGSIVIQTGRQKLWLQIDGYEEVLKRGIAPDDSHSEHFDVSGMDFVKFLDGTTLYYAADEVHVALGSETFLPNRPASSAHSLAAAIDRALTDRPGRRH